VHNIDESQGDKNAFDSPKNKYSGITLKQQEKILDIDLKKNSIDEP
jgi:hypothetical protein